MSYQAFHESFKQLLKSSIEQPNPTDDLKYAVSLAILASREFGNLGKRPKLTYSRAERLALDLMSIYEDDEE